MANYIYNSSDPNHHHSIRRQYIFGFNTSKYTSLQSAIIGTALASTLLISPVHAQKLTDTVIALNLDHTTVEAKPDAEQKLLQSQKHDMQDLHSEGFIYVEPMPPISLDKHDIDDSDAKDLDPDNVIPVTNGNKDPLYYTDAPILDSVDKGLRNAVTEALEEQWAEGGEGDTTLYPEEDEHMQLSEPGDDLGTLDFGSLSRITNPSRYPWRMNTRLIIRFPNGFRTACSGTLIDSRHVLTAAHCIYDRNRGGWASRVEAFPAYENGESDAYGFAIGNPGGLFTWTPWINNRNYDYDMGVVYLSRPIGALTGWFGYGYDSCSGLTTPSWFLASYPGTQGFDGETMHFQSGDFDTCPSSHQARRRNAAIGGQSGGGYYHIGAGGRYVRAVQSHNQWNWWHGYDADATRFNALKYYDVRRWINVHTPSSPDLIPLDVFAPQNYTSPGYDFSGANYLVHNYSNSSRSGYLTVKVYLSTNSYISQYDTLLQTHSVYRGFGPKSSVRVNIPTLRIPASTRYGNYYLGVIIQDADANASNNASHAQDSFKIRVL